MEYLASKLFALIAAAGSMLIAALLLGTALLWTKAGAKRGRALLTLMAILLAVTVFSPVEPWLTATLEDRFAADPKLPDHIDGVIVLGGMIRPGVSKAHGRPSLNDAAERLFDGAGLAKRHPEAVLLFTGGSADPLDPSAREAPYAAQLLRELGIAEPRLMVEDRSRNTWENAVFSRELVRPAPGTRWVLVTSAIHLPRAVGAFRRAGWDVIPWPVNYHGGGAEWVNEDLPLQRLYGMSRTLHEWIGLGYYRCRGWSDSLYPAPG